MAQRKPEDLELRGWKDIAAFLGQPVATAQRWAKTGMPVARQGRYMTASRDELRRWLGRESGADRAVHIATGTADLSADLHRALLDVRRQRKLHRVK
jgi:hypothetical protein